MRHETYQGFTNYETFVVHLWLTNVRETYDFWIDQAFQCRFDHANPKRARETLANRMSNTVTTYSDQHIHGDDNDFLSDLINSALAEVDWYEIADDFLEIAFEQVAA